MVSVQLTPGGGLAKMAAAGKHLDRDTGDLAQAQSIATGWQAELSLGFELRGARTILTHRRHRGPLTVQRPFHPGDGACHVYLLHPPAGVVGGDALHIDARAHERTHALVTTPGATRFYRSAGPRAEQDQRLVADDGATFEWLPQENIYFRGCDVRMRTRIDLAASARLLMWDMHCFARPANGEVFDAGRVDIGLSVYRDGRPLLLERQRHDAGNRQQKALMAGHAVTGVLLASGVGDDDLQRCRQVEAASGLLAVTQVDDLLAARYLGDSTRAARAAFVALWTILRPTVSGTQAVAPRIWST